MKNQFDKIIRSITKVGKTTACISENEIKDYYNDNELRFSASLEAYFLKLTGYRGIELDHVMLYGLTLLESAAQHIDCGYGKESTDSYCLIADFDDRMWFYAVDTCAQSSAPVFGIASRTKELIPVADTIEEFVVMSIENDSRLLF